MLGDQASLPAQEEEEEEEEQEEEEEEGNEMDDEEGELEPPAMPIMVTGGGIILNRDPPHFLETVAEMEEETCGIQPPEVHTIAVPFSGHFWWEPNSRSRYFHK